MLLTGLTARYTRALPAGWWLKLHRLSFGVFALAWTHGILAGTDSDAFRSAVRGRPAGASLGAAAYRYWVGKRRRPTFSTSLPEADTPVPATTHVANPVVQEEPSR